MEAPGLSLFQGSESIRLDTNAQRQEEDEDQEDVKRRNEEIKDLLTNAFDDLEEEDDMSSINSSQYHDTTREQSQNISKYQKEFGVYINANNNSDRYNESDLSFKPNENQIDHSISEVQRDFGYRETPHGVNHVDGEFTSVETPYELPRPPPITGGYAETRARINDQYGFHNSFPYHYDTPANHYENQSKNPSNNHYPPNNGYIDEYEPLRENVTKPHNAIGKGIAEEYGGGDNKKESSEHMNHCYKVSPNGKQSDDVVYRNAEYNSKEQLEVLYSVRMRELQRLTEELQRVQVEKEEEKNQLSRKLALVQAEAERSNLSRNQAQNALVDAKAEIADLQSRVEALKENNAVLEKSNRNMAEELSVAKNSVTDLQQKVAVLERVQALQTTDRTHEKFLKQAQEKHAVEMKNMQTQIDVLTDKLNTKEAAYVTLEHKLAEVRRAHEALMVEKGDTMNRLSQALEESQAQCRNLMASNNAQQVMQLQTQVKMLTQEKEDLLKNAEELQHKLDLLKSDVMQYDSLLAATSYDEESDSMRQLKLGESDKKRSKLPSDDIVNKLRGELQRCLAGQAVKRKEINRLENTLAQKERELEKAHIIAETCRQEAAKYAKRVNELEMELKSVLTEEATKANAEIQKLSSHLHDVKKQYEVLKNEKISLERKLEESLANQQTLTTQLENQNFSDTATHEFNKEYLEIHEKAVERVRQEAQVEIVQLTVQLEQTQKELDRVKELYIDVCGTKEQLIAEHKSEINSLKEKYANLETRKQDIERLERDLLTQTKIVEKLTKECESCRSKIIQLEKDLTQERRKKDEYTRKIHVEIERAKEEALKELRNGYPDREISLLIPDHCSEHLDKISQLEDDCKRLEEKLSVAVEEQRKMGELQSELDDARLRIAQMEISRESWRKKYDSAIAERKELLVKLSKLNNNNNSNNSSNNNKTSESEYNEKSNREQEILQEKCEKLSKEKKAYEEKINNLEKELEETKSRLEGRPLNKIEEELEEYRVIVRQLTHELNKKQNVQESRDNNKMEISKASEEMMKIKEERDRLIMKLKNQAKHFEEYIRSQRQVSAELHLSPRSSNVLPATEVTELQKNIRENTIKEVREEMEQKVAVELRNIEEKHRDKRREIENKYKSIVVELQTRFHEKSRELESLKEATISEKMKLHSSLKVQEQIVAQMIEAKIESFQQELHARKLQIEKLKEDSKCKEMELEEERNVMTQIMSEWASEIREIKAKEASLHEDVRKLKEVEDNLRTEIKSLKEKEAEMRQSIDALKHKYKAAKKSANNWKEYTEDREKFLKEECKRIEEGYNRAIEEVQEKVNKIVSTQEQQVSTKLKELRSQYDEEKMRLKMKYKNKC